MDQGLTSRPSNQQHGPSEHPTPKKKWFGNKTLLVTVGIILLFVIGGFLVFLNVSNRSQKSPATAAQTTITPEPAIPLKTEYTNPFDEKAKYQNPFSASEEYQNPFDTGR